MSITSHGRSLAWAGDGPNLLQKEEGHEIA